MKRVWAPVRRTVRGSLSENLGLKGVSLLLSVGLWGWLQSEQVVERRVRANVRYIWPEGLVHVEELPASLSVAVSGAQGRLRDLPEEGLTLDIDLSTADEGKVAIDFTERTFAGLPDGATIVQVTPPVIDVQLDKRRTKKVRIRPSLLGEPADGWQRGEVKVEPSTVEITGPQSLVRNITEAGTDIVDISGVRATKSVSVPLVFPRSSVTANGQREVQVTVEISPIVSERTFEAVPVRVSATGWRSPTATARVEVAGPVRFIRELDPENMHLELDLPAAVPVDQAVEIRWDPALAAGPVRFVHGGPDEVLIQKMVPDTFTLQLDE